MMQPIHALAAAGFLTVLLAGATSAEPTDNMRHTLPPEADTARSPDVHTCQIFTGGVVLPS